MVLAVQRPGCLGGGVVMFVATALPFGAVSSVLHFTRLARAFLHVARSALGLVCTSYFDDFVQLEVVESATSAQWALEALCDVCGWRYSKKEQKRQPFR
eukprot:3912869-Amphidinium_carterae.1